MKAGTNLDRSNLILDIFQTALEVPLSERGEYLTRACGDDEALRLEVESLLANDRSDTAYLRSLVARAIKGLTEGQKIGPYRLIRELDSGGMGSVYLAVRSDDHYFQIVAIKMVRRSMESPALVQRFRAERQILATLTHPNIGAILDGGDTDDGRPYLVMEYVEGQPITVASKTRALSIRQRIELFRAVCSAVHYAHQKLVIHRDIKPGNVLVTSEGVVKLIDFGISKPLAPELIPGQLAATETGQRLLTPDYASPEQVLGKPLTTATDIYSLGVVLFELLTGSRPYELRDLSPAAAERVICAQENRKLSSISTLSKQLRKELAGDLDRIVLTAMDKDPSQRYSSAEDLEQDLVRFLEGKPILARRPTPVYLLSKSLARHKTASVMAAVTTVALAGSILFFSMQSRTAEARIRQVQALADGAISDMTEKLQQSSASVEVQASLFHSAVNSLNQLRQSSGNDPRLLLRLSKAYGRVGDLEGSPYVDSLGNTVNAITSYREALDTAIAAHSRSPSEESTRVVIEAYLQLGQTENFSGYLEQARDHYQRCFALTRDFLQRDPEDPVRKRLLAANYANFGYLQLNSLETDKAADSVRGAIQILGPDPNGNEDHDRALERFYVGLGNVLNELGSNDESIACFQRSIQIAEEVARRFPSRSAKRDACLPYNNIVGPLAGREMLNEGKAEQAQSYARHAVAMAEELAASDNTNMQARSDLAYSYTKMAAALFSSSPAEASVWYQKSIALTKELGPRFDEPLLLAERDEYLASLLVNRAQAPERFRLLREANIIRQESSKRGPTPPHDRVHLMRSYCRLSDAELGLNHLAEARRDAELSLPLFNEFKLTSPSLVVLRDIGLCYESLGNVRRRMAMDVSLASSERATAAAAARDWYTKSMDVWNEWVRRGAATPDSEVERHKVERLLKTR